MCIAGQCSGFAGNTSYGRPIVAFFSGDGAVAATTVGDQEVYVHGSNFGPIGTFVTAVYTTGDTGSSVIQASTVIQQPSYWTLTGETLP